jgi:Spy/CpxP family protein refolding chaperone
MKTLLSLRALPFLLLALLVALPLVASAGEGKGGHGGKRHHDPEERLARMTEHLNLTAEQQAELRPILEEQAESFRAMRESKAGGADREQLRSDFRAQREATTAQIDAILDDQQRAEFHQRREEHRAKRKQGRGERHGKGAPDDAL